MMELAPADLDIMKTTVVNNLATVRNAWRFIAHGVNARAVRAGPGVHDQECAPSRSRHL